MRKLIRALRARWRRLDAPRFVASREDLADGTIAVGLFRYRLAHGWLGPRVVAEDLLASARFSAEQADEIGRCISRFAQAAELGNRGELGAYVRASRSADGTLNVALVENVLTADDLRREVLDERQFDPADENALVSCAAYRSELESRAEDLNLEMRPGTATAAEAFPTDTRSLPGSRWWKRQRARRAGELERLTR